MLWMALGCAIALLLAQDAVANHGHDNPPCWANGYGDGANNNHVLHPLIEYQGDLSCGYDSLAGNARIAMHYHPGAAGTGGWDRTYYEHCGGVYVCEAYIDYSAAKGQSAPNECKFAAAVTNESAFSDHWHYHHYTCAFI